MGEEQIDKALMDAAKQGKTATFCTVEYTVHENNIIPLDKFVKDIKERYTKAGYNIRHRYRTCKNERIDVGNDIVFDIYWEY